MVGPVAPYPAVSGCLQRCAGIKSIEGRASDRDFAPRMHIVAVRSALHQPSKNDERLYVRVHGSDDGGWQARSRL